MPADQTLPAAQTLLDHLEARLAGPASVAALEAVVEDLRLLAGGGDRMSPPFDPAQLQRIGALLQGWGEWGQGWQDRLRDLAPPLTYDRAGIVTGGLNGAIHG